ncbi:sensor histidine kinase [Chryseobacterium arthrosphaerae]|uniref:sensor histidine kinase n=1 Tax=Chryseobacterium arthrosphaerae TaxID=651561 RepID=UPI001F4B3E68|nr:sensor histidine kinase [Chryseobacterium arthrosphaerae]
MSILEKAIRYSTVYRVSSHILFWLVVFIVPQYQEGTSLRDMLIENTFYLSFYMMASYFVAYIIIPKLLKGDNYIAVILWFIIGSYAISAFSRIMVVHVMEPLIRKPPFEQESILEILTDIRKLVVIYFLQNFSLAWIFGFIKLVKDQYVVKQRTLWLEKEKTKAELATLKAQLNPHFLFNTLNNIYALSLANSPVTSPSIAGLSEILDHVLYRCNGSFVPVSTEIKLLENYIELEKLRYDERLMINFKHTIDEDLDIVPLILLSIVENAFKHGAGEDIGNPVIDIELLLNKGNFHFRVCNTFTAKEHNDSGDKIGLDNIYKQLELVYPGNHEFKTFIHESTFVTLLSITDLRINKT